jgi:hydrogenase maturation protease
VLWADEGFGVRAAEALHDRFSLEPDGLVMDGGTQGMFLVPYVCAARSLLIFDAVDFGLPGGTLRLVRDDDVPQYMGAKKVSMHQTGFQEVLAAARLLDQAPERITLIGVQPLVLDDYGGSLRPDVKAAIPEAVELAVAELRAWGVGLRERLEPLSRMDRISPRALDMAPYEADRPPSTTSPSDWPAIPALQRSLEGRRKP